MRVVQFAVENTLKINEKTNSIIICKCAGFF